MTDTPFPLVVIGAGPCGLAVGAAARQQGMAAVLIDQGPLCASLQSYPPYMTFYSTSDKLEIAGIPFTSSSPNPTRREALAYYRGIARYFELDVRQYHRVESIERTGQPAKPGFRLSAQAETGEWLRISTRAVVFATGGFHAPNLLGVPGEELPKVTHAFHEAHPYWNQDVLVVGGGNSAVESALDLFRVGARVTMVHFKDQFDSGVKPWLLPDIHNRLRDLDIGMFWSHRITEIHPKRVVLQSEGSGDQTEIVNDRVLALTGWRPDHRLLEGIGIPVDPESGIPCHHTATMETPVQGAFVAGVLAAGFDANRIFIENGREHGAMIVRHLISRS